jgi:hypothetical protein
MMRTSVSRKRKVRPTLLAPPNSFWLRSAEITATWARLVSSSAVQPLPYWNGTSNIEKKSAVIDAIVGIVAGRLTSGARMRTGLSMIRVWRSARCALHRSTAD